MSDEQNDTNQMEVCFSQDAAHTGVQIMNRLFEEGWETLVPLDYACGYYYTILCPPKQKPNKPKEPNGP